MPLSNVFLPTTVRAAQTEGEGDEDTSTLQPSLKHAPSSNNAAAVVQVAQQAAQQVIA